jgi:hypothetical protein
LLLLFALLFSTVFLAEQQKKKLPNDELLQEHFQFINLILQANEK